jgi:hypothetical protein
MPARAGIDPHHKLIQREATDNVVEVGTTTAAAPAGRRKYTILSRMSR